MIRSIRISLAALAVAGTLVSGGCSSGGGSGGGGGGVTNPPGVIEIHATAGNRFTPSTLTVTRGTTVRWVADASSGHTVTPDNAAQPGVFSSASIGSAGDTFEFTFNTAGDFSYHCIPHQSLGMTGVVHVQ
ncbi:cupredoxin domain-containing protein [Longimicrobium sp.]|uniref:cupredoxin domain-containing protein n=1 Tax=Longimicrobium sp. TaxID=2029185 RepID=UPI002BD1E7A4|nr:plastocyanin/azurin family copper-binding protein [Longimicrobium sp.]HSU16015.1 plastocyanin/azurin family copper-binding protein [Longimicrobium sp.]